MPTQQQVAVRTQVPQQTTKRRVPLVYDASSYGHDLPIPLIDPTLTGTKEITFSAAGTVHRSTVHDFAPTGGSATDYVPLIHSTDSLLSNLDTGLIVHEGDNTAFEQNYLLESDMSAAVHQIQCSFAVAMTVAAWTDATLALDSVSITLSSYMNAGQPLDQPQTLVIRPSSAFSALAAAGTHLFIVREVIDIPLSLRVHGPLIMNIKINTTGTRGSDTYQVGLVDMWPIAKSTAAKRLLPSELIMHMHPIPEHVEELVKYTDYEMEGTGVRKS